MGLIKFAAKMILACIIFFPAMALGAYAGFRLWKFITMYLLYFIGIPVQTLNI